MSIWNQQNTRYISIDPPLVVNHWESAQSYHDIPPVGQKKSKKAMKYVRTPENQASLGTMHAKLQAISFWKSPQKICILRTSTLQCNCWLGNNTPLTYPHTLLPLWIQGIFDTRPPTNTILSKPLSSMLIGWDLLSRKHRASTTKHGWLWPFPRCAHQNPVASSVHRIMVQDFRYTPSSVHRSFPFRWHQRQFHLKVWTSHHISIIASTHGGSSRCVSSACFGTVFGGLGVGKTRLPGTRIALGICLKGSSGTKKKVVDRL